MDNNNRATMSIQYGRGDQKIMVESIAATQNEPGKAILYAPKMMKVSSYDLNQIGWMLINFSDRLSDEEVTIDETEYLLSNPANAAHLKQSIAEEKDGRLIEVEFVDGVLREK